MLKNDTLYCYKNMVKKKQLSAVSDKFDLSGDYHTGYDIKCLRYDENEKIFKI